MLSWCRLCLKKSECFLSLLDNKILKKVESLTSLQFDLNDKLPQNCCQSCADNVITCYNFQQLVVESDKWLREGGILSNQEIIQDAYLAPETYEVCQDENYSTVEPKVEVNESVCKTEEDLSYGEVQSFVENNDQVVGCMDEDYANHQNMGYDGTYENFTPDSNDVPSPGSFVSDQSISSNVPLDVEISYEQHSSSDKSSDNVEGDYPCKDCNLKFSSKRNLQKHAMKHNIEQCPHCTVTMRRDNLKRHIQKHSDPPIKCEICGTIAKNRESLRGHINYHHRNNPIVKCEHCSKEFKSKHHYNTHIKKVHLNIRDAQCEHCGNKFYANHDLLKHIRMKHNKERPYQCSQCLKFFSSRYALKTHLRQHNGEKPFSCQICAMAFKQKVSLNNHLKSRHGVVKEEEDKNASKTC